MEISVVIPAYQEEARIGATVSAMCRYLDAQFPDSELIVVCDGCRDRTATVARDAGAGSNCQLKIIELEVNSGKGAAVKTGMLAASGQYLFFTDADLSYRPENIAVFKEKLASGADIAIAQRNKNEVYPQFARRVLASVSRFLVGNIVLPGLRDTQAGFKAFRRDCARDLFARQKTSRFLFDLELLVIARQLGYSIEKLYIDWEDREGSTVQVFLDSSRAMRDLILIMFWRITGQYKKEPRLVETKDAGE